MSGGAAGEIARHLRQIFGEGTLAGLTDGQLLDRFRATGDDVAFSAIVARHGPMVLGVCRSVLRDPTDADDAFQAVFLVLARRAGTVRGPACVGGWLYRVSRRVAVRAATARRARPAGGPFPDRADDHDTADPARAADRRELRALVHEELARLPGPYRDVILLCDLEGLSHDAAARRLGWPVGTVKGRLARGRDRLRDRLRRRGVTGPVPALTAMPTAVSEALLTRTVALASGAAGTVPAGVAMLVSEALRAMFWSHLKQWALGIGLLGLLAGGVSAIGGAPGDGPAPAGREAPSDAPAEPEPRPADEPTPDADNAERRAELAGERADAELLEIELEAQRAAIEELAQTLASRVVMPDRLTGAAAGAFDKLQATYERHKAEYRQRAIELERRKNALAAAAGLRIIQPGDLLVVEVLEALPGRPLTGQRVVRPDGTLSLDFYGELKVAGLTRHQIKEKLILHLRRFLKEDTLGLVEVDPDTGKNVPVPPGESDRVYVDDSLNDMPAEALPDTRPRPRSDPNARRLDALERKLDQVLQRLGEPPGGRRSGGE